MPVFLTAPKDLQRTPAYDELLRLLRQERHQREEVVADRDLFRDTRHWKKNWKELYKRADKLYVLARDLQAMEVLERAGSYLGGVL